MQKREIRSLNDIALEEWETFKRKVAGSNGRVVILVHPFFEKAPPEYFKSLANLMKRSSVPIIILEEFHRINLLRGNLAKNKLNISDFLVLPTVRQSSNLIIAPASAGCPAIKDESSRRLIEWLNVLGVNEVFVGGMRTIKLPSRSLETKEHIWLPEGRTPEKKIVTKGCAGAIYNQLILYGNFKKIRLIPNVCAPEKPKYHKKTPASVPRRKPKGKSRMPKPKSL